MAEDDSTESGPWEVVVAAAEDLAADLQKDVRWQQGEYGGGYWVADDPKLLARIRARAVAGIDFLERFSGAESPWTFGARNALANSGEKQSMESGARAVGDLLTAWTEQVRAGRLVPRTVEALGAREVAATDLMEQVRRLNSDPSVTPAAPIVLAGAALEVSLRSAIDQLGIVFDSKPSIATYAKALRSADFLGKQDMKDVEQMAGLRNDAAHGEFDSLSRERAGLMEQQVNLFLTRLDQLLRPVS